MSEVFLSPIGRIVQGSVHQLRQATDDAGNPKVIASGANAGQPQMELFFALAIEKQSPDWPAFKQQLDRVAQQAFPGGEWNSPNFSNKVIDGDGYDQSGQFNGAKEGFAGHWVVRFKTGYAIQAVKGGVTLDPKTIRCGDYVRVTGTVAGNGGGRAGGKGPRKPGLYLNPNGVEFFGYGQEIVAGPDVKEAFKAAPAPTYRPAGMSNTPVAGAAAAGAPAAPAMPAAPAAPAAPPLPPPVPGTPGNAFAFPGAAPAPAPAPAPAGPAPCPRGAPAGFRMTDKGPWTYQQLIASSHTPESLLNENYMVRV